MRIAVRERRNAAPGRRRLSAEGTALVALVIAAPLVLSACGGGSSDNSASTSSGVQRVPAAGAPQQGSAQNGLAAQQPNGGAAVGGSNGGNSGSGANTSTTTVKLPNRSLIITAGLQVKTDDASVAAQRAQVIAEGAGGYVAGESIGPGPQSMPPTPSGASSDGPSSPATLPGVTGPSNSTQALLVLRVPPQSVDSVLAALAGKGAVTYQSRNTTDVTGQVADVASRVTSAQAAIAELRTFIEKAASMNDLISLEQALAQRESDLESLEAQQKSLADQVQFATITVGYFSQGAPAAAPPAVHTGFMRGLTLGWHGFLTVVRGVLAVLGWLVPYAVLIIVLWWPVRRLVLVVLRRNRARRTPPAQTPTPAASSEG